MSMHVRPLSFRRHPYSVQFFYLIGSTAVAAAAAVDQRDVCVCVCVCVCGCWLATESLHDHRFNFGMTFGCIAFDHFGFLFCLAGLFWFANKLASNLAMYAVMCGGLLLDPFVFWSPPQQQPLIDYFE